MREDKILLVSYEGPQRNYYVYIFQECCILLGWIERFLLYYATRLGEGSRVSMASSQSRVERSIVLASFWNSLATGFSIILNGWPGRFNLSCHFDCSFRPRVRGPFPCS